MRRRWPAGAVEGLRRCPCKRDFGGCPVGVVRCGRSGGRGCVGGDRGVGPGSAQGSGRVPAEGVDQGSAGVSECVWGKRVGAYGKKRSAAREGARPIL